MRSFVITLLCFGALAGGVLLGFVGVHYPFEGARAWDSGPAAAQDFVTSLVSSAAGSHDGQPASGIHFPAHPNWTWHTTDGQTYENVVITNLSATEVTIAHDGGVAHLSLNVLPPDIQGELRDAASAGSAPTAAAPLTSSTAPAAPPAANSTNGLTPIAAMVDNKLVDLHGQDVATPGSSVRYYAVYYSAGWCPPCHAFTPELIHWYLKFKPSHPNFELIFVSHDHSESDMYAYMQEMLMPWPAVKYSELPGNSILKYANSAIPDLVLVDSSGNVLADSFNGGTYLGPQSVVEYMNEKLGGN